MFICSKVISCFDANGCSASEILLTIDNPFALFSLPFGACHYADIRNLDGIYQGQQRSKGRARRSNFT